MILIIFDTVKILNSEKLFFSVQKTARILIQHSKNKLIAHECVGVGLLVLWVPGGTSVLNLLIAHATFL